MPREHLSGRILLRGGELYVHEVRLQPEEMRQIIKPMWTGNSRLLNVQLYIMTNINIFANTQ